MTCNRRERSCENNPTRLNLDQSNLDLIRDRGLVVPNTTNNLVGGWKDYEKRRILNDATCSVVNNREIRSGLVFTRLGGRYHVQTDNLQDCLNEAFLPRSQTSRNHDVEEEPCDPLLADQGGIDQKNLLRVLRMINQQRKPIYKLHGTSPFTEEVRQARLLKGSRLSESLKYKGCDSGGQVLKAFTVGERSHVRQHVKSLVLKRR
uniref:Uncharacterized protein n=1 Tax=Cannabis sativa TaxID=3483 RepID=A0A803NK72_CANSA